MQPSTIGFIGAGNMACGLIHGLLAAGYAPERIWVSNPHRPVLDNLEQRDVKVHQDNRHVAEQVDVLIFAVKPQVLYIVMSEVAAVIKQKKPLLISVAAGVSLHTLQSNLQIADAALIRSMPNTPTQFGCGMTGLIANSFCSEEQKKLATEIFQSVGLITWLKTEQEMDIVTAISGSGPAYFFLLIQSLEEAAIELGLPHATATQLSTQTALGAARMAIESTESIEQLKRNVTSPGGTTERALAVFETGRFPELVKKAVKSAAERAKELATQF